jgi:nickel-dependent lactate racemase
MTSHTVTLRTGAFFAEGPLVLAFPAVWQVRECHMAGHGRPPLSDEDMRQALRSPIGSARLSELARGAREVCILFDDLTKPTPADRIVPFVLEELHAAGIADGQIRFLCASGAHRFPVDGELAAKLGRGVLERYPVYVHNVWNNVVHLGQTRCGTPVTVNREFAVCDLRLGIGGVLGHDDAGFGGGAKLVVPGVCGIQTIEHMHRNIPGRDQLGRLEHNTFRLNLEEAARLAGLHFKVDAVLNEQRQVVGLFAGDFVAEHRAAVELARRVYRCEALPGADVVVANTYPTENQAIRAQWCVPASLREGGDAVFVRWHAGDAENLHQIYSRFGSDFGGSLWAPDLKYSRLAKADHVFLLTPHLSRYDRDTIGPPGRLTWCTTWDDLLGQLVPRHGAGTRVAVYPYAALQMAGR